MYKRPFCKFCNQYGHYQYQCYRKPRKKTLSKTSKTRSKVCLGSKTVVVSPRKKTEQNKRKKLIKELDKYTSILVRLGAADKNGITTCYTSGERVYWRQLDAGHYISRRFMRTRWDLKNIRPQSVKDNRYLGGNYKVYEKKIKAELGEDEVLKLWDKAYSGKKIPTYELEEMLVEIKQKYKELIRERKEKGYKC